MDYRIGQEKMLLQQKDNTAIKIAMCALSFVALSFVFSLATTFLLHRPTMKVIAQWEQPDSISYNDYSKCYADVIEDDLDWSGFPYHVERNYFLYFGHDEGKPTYGHIIKFSFHNEVEDIVAFINKSQVEWSTEGATFIEASGHRLFVPKDMFIRDR